MSSPISSSLAPTARSPERDRGCSSKVGTGSRQEDASKQRTKAPFRLDRNGNGSGGTPVRATRSLVAEGSSIVRRKLSGEKGVLLGCCVLALLIFAAGSRARAEDLNDYPTSARADYVFACMKANGETQEILQKCSCSIDVIASIIPYDRYVATETILSMSQVTGPIGSEFRSTEHAKLAVQDFRRAQAEAEVRCF
jgi:hypothetical protein